METVVKKLYEALFLVDSAQAASDWDGVNGVIKKILEKAGAEIVSMRKWDERKLAYEIGGKARGTYILCYFKVEGGKIAGIERDVQLCEQIMRVLILCAEHMSREDIEKDTPATLVEKPPEQKVQEPDVEQQADTDVSTEEKIQKPAEAAETVKAGTDEPQQDEEVKDKIGESGNSNNDTE